MRSYILNTPAHRPSLTIHPCTYQFLYYVATLKQPKAAKQSTITQKGLRTHAQFIRIFNEFYLFHSLYMVVCTAAKASARKKVQKKVQKVQGPSATQELPPIAKSIVIGAKVRHAYMHSSPFVPSHPPALARLDRACRRKAVPASTARPLRKPTGRPRRKPTGRRIIRRQRSV